MLSLLFKYWGRLPLPLLHGLGRALGRLLFHTMPKAKQLAAENIKQSQLSPTAIKEAVQQNFINLGELILETPYIWQTNNKKTKEIIQSTSGWDEVEAAIAAKKGIVFLTPHMGCYEVGFHYCALYFPVSVLYRPPKKKWLQPFVIQGRERSNLRLAEANATGVRILVKALKKGEAIGILPDQVPNAGDGEWADFFGNPAYTMTLASKLAEKTGATIIMLYGERLAKGEGYVLHCTKVESINTAALLNKAVEKQIKQRPEQYNWHYHRYKVRRKAKEKLQQNHA